MAYFFDDLEPMTARERSTLERVTDPRFYPYLGAEDATRDDVIQDITDWQDDDMEGLPLDVASILARSREATFPDGEPGHMQVEAIAGRGSGIRSWVAILALGRSQGGLARVLWRHDYIESYGLTSDLAGLRAVLAYAMLWEDVRDSLVAQARELGIRIEDA